MSVRRVEVELRKARTAFARVVVIAVLTAVASCSGGANRVTTGRSSTTDGVSTTAAVRSFFAHDGEPLLAFERATAVLTTGKVPAPSTCLHLTEQVLPKVISDPNVLVKLTTRVPDPKLARALGQDVALRIIVVMGCGHAPLASNDRSGSKAYAGVHDSAVAVRNRLASYGIAL